MAVPCSLENFFCWSTRYHRLPSPTLSLLERLVLQHHYRFPEHTTVPQKGAALLPRATSHTVQPAYWPSHAADTAYSSSMEWSPM